MIFCFSLGPNESSRGGGGGGEREATLEFSDGKALGTRL